MSSHKLKPITIVGGGLAGLTLGIALRQRGIPVVVFESGTYPRHRVCGEFISGRGQDVLARLGLRDVLQEAGAQVAEDALFVVGERTGPCRRLEHSGFTAPRFTLDATLASRFEACGGKLQLATRWQDGCGEGLVRASGRRLQPVEGGSRWFGLKVHVKNVALGAALEMHSLPHGYVGLCRLKGGDVNVCGLFRSPGKRVSGPGQHSNRVQASAASLPNVTPPKLAGANPRMAAPRSATDAFEHAWREVLGAYHNPLLAARFADAVFDRTSFCSVAGLGMDSQLPISSPECRIGDALTLIPPITGNGMSMAFEAAEQAVEPLAAYSSSTLSWAEAQEAISQSCRRAFRSRLTWASFLQWLMFAPTVRQHFSTLALNSGLLWRVLFAKTR